MADLNREALEAARTAVKGYAIGYPMQDISTCADVAILAYLRASPSQVAPANPAQVTDALIAAVVALPRHGIEPDVQSLLVDGNPSRGIRPGALVAALTAAIGAGEQAVARENVAYFTDDKWGGYWQTVRDGKPYNFRIGTRPADERVVEALRMAHSFIAREYRDEKSLALEGEFVSKEARPVFRALSDALSATEGR